MLVKKLRFLCHILLFASITTSNGMMRVFTTNSTTTLIAGVSSCALIASPFIKTVIPTLNDSLNKKLFFVALGSATAISAGILGKKLFDKYWSLKNHYFIINQIKKNDTWQSKKFGTRLKKEFDAKTRLIVTCDNSEYSVWQPLNGSFSAPTFSFDFKSNSWHSPTYGSLETFLHDAKSPFASATFGTTIDVSGAPEIALTELLFFAQQHPKHQPPLITYGNNQYLTNLITTNKNKDYIKTLDFTNISNEKWQKTILEETEYAQHFVHFLIKNDWRSLKPLLSNWQIAYPALMSDYALRPIHNICMSVQKDSKQYVKNNYRSFACSFSCPYKKSDTQTECIYCFPTNWRMDKSLFQISEDDSVSENHVLKSAKSKKEIYIEAAKQDQTILSYEQRFTKIKELVTFENLDNSEEIFMQLAELTEGYTASDLTLLLFDFAQQFETVVQEKDQEADNQQEPLFGKRPDTETSAKTQPLYTKTSVFFNNLEDSYQKDFAYEKTMFFKELEKLKVANKLTRILKLKLQLPLEEELENYD